MSPDRGARSRARQSSWQLFLASALILAPERSSAQEAGWHAKGQLNASLAFGATSQRLADSQAELSFADSTVELSSSLGFRYGDSDDAEGVRSIVARSWRGSLTADGRPFAAVSPFVFASAETSLERRLARRVAGGAGARWMLVRRPATRASVSLALLFEHVRPLRSAGDQRPDQSLARASFRARFDRSAGPLTISHVTFYQPSVATLSNYLVTSTTRVGVSVTKVVAVTMSLADTYDSGARERGARAANDGRLLFGIAASY